MRLTDLKAIRMRQGMTLEDVARRMKSTPSTISRFENGRTPLRPTDEFIGRYARAVKKPLREVLNAVDATFRAARRVAA